MYLILDPDLKVCGTLSLEGKGCKFYNDVRTVQIADDTGKLWNDTLTISVPYGYPQAEMMTEGYHLLKQGDDGYWYCFRISNWEDDLMGSTYVKIVQATNLCIWDLAHTNVVPATLTGVNSTDAFNHCLQNSGWELGTDNFFGGSNDETFNLGDSAQSMIQTLTSDYSVEIRAYVELNNGQIINKTIDIQAQLGEATGRRIEYRRNLLNITRQGDDSQLFTKIQVYGGTPDGQNSPISIASVNNGLDYLIDDDANDQYNNGSDKYLEGFTQNTNITDPGALLTWGQQQLALYNHPKYNYTVDVSGLDWIPNLGDTVDVVDFEMQPELTISARVIQKMESESDVTANQVVLGEFVEIPVEIPAAIKSLQVSQLIVQDSSGNYSAVDGSGMGVNVLNATQINSNSVVPLNLDTPDTPYTVGSGEIQQLLDGLPLYNQGNLTIQVTEDTTETVDISGYTGQGTITIDFGGHKLTGSISITGNTNKITVQNGNITSSDPNVIYIGQTVGAEIASMVLNGNNNSTNGVKIDSGASGYVHDCTINNMTYSGVEIASGGIAVLDNNTGSGTQMTHGYAILGGSATGIGTTPTGTGNAVVATNGGYSGGAWSTPTTGTTSTTTVQPTTTTWTSSNANDYSNSGYWDDTNQAKQGNWGYGRRTGLFFFPSTMASALSGKTISALSVYLYRPSTGGNSSDVTIYVRTHNYSSAPSGAPTVDTSNDVTISLPWGGSGWVSLPSSMFNQFSNGSAKGIAIYIASDTKSYYAVFNATNCKVKATYK